MSETAVEDAAEEEDGYVSETLRAITAWAVVLQNELELLGVTEQVLELWNYLVGIQYHREFQIMSLQYAATVDMPLERITGIRFSYIGGPNDELTSYTINAPHVQIRLMRCSKAYRGPRDLDPDSEKPKLEQLPLGPVLAEMASIRAELEQLASIKRSLVDCAPPHGKEYRLALRRASAHGMGRYALRPSPPSRNRVAS
jgi:hypothetical protein